MVIRFLPESDWTGSGKGKEWQEGWGPLFEEKLVPFPRGCLRRAWIRDTVCRVQPEALLCGDLESWRAPCQRPPLITAAQKDPVVSYDFVYRFW